MSAGPRNPSEACRAVEATLVRQLLDASKAFHSSDESGSKLRTDLFVETLATALSDAGGLGLASSLEADLARGGAQEETDAAATTSSDADGALRPLPGTEGDDWRILRPAGTTRAMSADPPKALKSYGKRAEDQSGKEDMTLSEGRS